MTWLLALGLALVVLAGSTEQIAWSLTTGLAGCALLGLAAILDRTHP